MSAKKALDGIACHAIADMVLIDEGENPIPTREYVHSKMKSRSMTRVPFREGQLDNSRRL